MTRSKNIKNSESGLWTNKITHQEVINSLWCNDCGRSYGNHCEQHGDFLRIQDKKIPSRARLTLPHQLALRIVEIRAGNDEYGVFAKRILQNRTQFGPFAGELTHEGFYKSRENKIKIVVWSNNGEKRYLNCTNEAVCNWMMFVRPAKNIEEQNLVVFQYKSEIYFVTTKVVATNEELKVWYAKDYAEICGVTLLANDDDNNLVHSDDYNLEHSKTPSPPSPFTGYKPEDIKSEKTPPKKLTPYLTPQAMIDQSALLTDPSTDKLNTLANVALQPFYGRIDFSTLNSLDLRDENRNSAAFLTENSTLNLMDLKEQEKAHVNVETTKCNIQNYVIKSDSEISHPDNNIDDFNSTSNIDCDKSESETEVGEATTSSDAKKNSKKCLNCSKSCVGLSSSDDICKCKPITKNKVPTLDKNLKATSTKVNAKQKANYMNNVRKNVPRTKSSLKLSLSEKRKLRLLHHNYTRSQTLVATVKTEKSLSENEELSLENKKKPGKAKVTGTSEGKSKNDPKVKRAVKSKLKRSKRKVIICEKCGKAFSKQSGLKLHMQQHTGERLFKCPHAGCGKGFLTNFKLNRHITIHGDGKKFRCQYCEKEFGRKDHLKHHMKIHDPNKKFYLCTHCDKKYTSVFAQKCHVAFHRADDGELECFVCKKNFQTMEELRFHLKVHAGLRSVKDEADKKHQCDHCPKKFFTVKDARRHAVVHTKERSHMCHLCALRFGRKDHLVRHLKKAHFANSQGKLIETEDIQNTETVVNAPEILDIVNKSTTVTTGDQSKRKRKRAPKINKITDFHNTRSKNINTLPMVQNIPVDNVATNKVSVIKSSDDVTAVDLNIQQQQLPQPVIKRINSKELQLLLQNSNLIISPTSQTADSQNIPTLPNSAIQASSKNKTAAPILVNSFPLTLISKNENFIQPVATVNTDSLELIAKPVVYTAENDPQLASIGLSNSAVKNNNVSNSSNQVNSSNNVEIMIANAGLLPQNLPHLYTTAISTDNRGQNNTNQPVSLFTGGDIASNTADIKMADSKVQKGRRKRKLGLARANLSFSSKQPTVKLNPGESILEHLQGKNKSNSAEVEKFSSQDSLLIDRGASFSGIAMPDNPSFSLDKINTVSLFQDNTLASTVLKQEQDNTGASNNLQGSVQTNNTATNSGNKTEQLKSSGIMIPSQFSLQNFINAANNTNNTTFLIENVSSDVSNLTNQQNTVISLNDNNLGLVPSTTPLHSQDISNFVDQGIVANSSNISGGNVQMLQLIQSPDTSTRNLLSTSNQLLFTPEKTAVATPNVEKSHEQEQKHAVLSTLRLLTGHLPYNDLTTSIGNTGVSSVINQNRVNLRNNISLQAGSTNVDTDFSSNSSKATSGTVSVETGNLQVPLVSYDSEAINIFFNDQRT